MEHLVGQNGFSDDEPALIGTGSAPREQRGQLEWNAEVLINYGCKIACLSSIFHAARVKQESLDGGWSETLLATV